jgi:hypothetical protein
MLEEAWEADKAICNDTFGCCAEQEPQERKALPLDRSKKHSPWGNCMQSTGINKL